jgi:Tfp pilus assembly protein PilN
MNAVNLLPPKHRPRQATGGKSGSSFVLIGLLGAIVVALLVYVLSVNSINDSKTQISEAKAETAQANARADSLVAYGDFAKVKTQRVNAVKDLASNRYDWERAVRELAHVLPGGVWITKASASDGSATGGDTGSAPVSATTTGAGSLTLTACARDQQTVATALVRLRQVQGAEDVKLSQSSKPESSEAGSSSSSTSDAGCGTTHGSPNYSFEAVVTLSAPDKAAKHTGSVPASLGGGQ